MKRFLLIASACAGLAACEEAQLAGPGPTVGPPPPPSGAFRAADFGWSLSGGPDLIDGVLAYRGAGGRYTCSDVVLAPETPWSRERMRTLYLSTTSAALPVDDVKSRTTPEHGAEYARYARHASCDAAGRISFTNLPDGAWYVITVATPAAGGSKIAVMRRAETHGGAVRIVLR